MKDTPLRLVVGPLSRSGGLAVRAGAEILGMAYRPEEVIEFARRAGLDEVELTDPVIEWRGGGPDVWV